MHGDGSRPPICFDHLLIDGSQKDTADDTESQPALELEQEPVPYADQLAKPREFRVSPSTGVLPAQSTVTVTVYLCSNTVKRCVTALAVDFEEVGKKAFMLPISAKYVLPLDSLLK